MAGYAIVIEDDGEGDSFSAYDPQFSGCIAKGKSVAVVEKLMRDAIEFHLEGMKPDGNPSAATTVATAIARSRPSGSFRANGRRSGIAPGQQWFSGSRRVLPKRRLTGHRE